MEDNSLTRQYNATVTGTEEVDGRQCWVVDLKAIVPDIAYQGMKLWVDRERNIPLREEMFAKSGTLLKRTELSDVQKIGNRWYPRKILFRDMLRDGKGTEFIIEEIEFNVPIPEHIFSKASLKK